MTKHALSLSFLAAAAGLNVSSALAAGPDVIVGDLNGLSRYGVVGGITAYSVGTTSCNIGDFWLDWFQNTNRHPVIGQNMFRYKVVDGAGRFEQIGQSWLKHGFFALSEGLCFSDCQPTNGQHLGVHCSDPYSSGLNGQQSNLGPRSQVNASTGVYPYPWSAPSAPATIGRRLQVRNTDLNPVMNLGAFYLVEGQYVTPDDAAAGNKDNNASYRRINVTGSDPTYQISFSGSTVREKAAIEAWKQQFDPAVTIVTASVSREDGRFILGYKVTQINPTTWRYEYAIQNLNSHQSGGSFSVPIPACAVVTNMGFHDVDSHSGEPYSLTDWASAATGGNVTWATDTFAQNPNANALRWGTMYNFRFDANLPPAPGTATIGLFRAGPTSSLDMGVAVPSAEGCGCDADFNGDGMVNVADFLAFLGAYANGDLTADFDGDGTITIGDFLAFLSEYSAGC